MFITIKTLKCGGGEVVESVDYILERILRILDNRELFMLPLGQGKVWQKESKRGPWETAGESHILSLFIHFSVVQIFHMKYKS